MPVFEAEEVTALAEAAKLELRKRMRALRAAHPAATLAARSAAIVQRAAALDEFRAARGVGLFFPLSERQEVDLRALDALARELGKRVYYPFLEQRAEALLTGMRLSASIADVSQRGQRFCEPPPDAPQAARGELDLLFVPALAVAPSGHRLGYGSGFYDATLPDFCPPARAIVVAYDYQFLVELPVLPHDVACHGVVTDARTLLLK